MLPNHYNYIGWVMHDLYLVSLLFIAVIDSYSILKTVGYCTSPRYMSGDDDQFTYFSELESEVLQCHKQHNQLYIHINTVFNNNNLQVKQMYSVHGQGSTQVHMNP